MIAESQTQVPLIDDEDDDSPPGYESMRMAEQVLSTPEEQLQHRLDKKLNHLILRDWSGRLERAQFQGDKEQGQIIMHSVAEGARDVIKALNKRGKVPLKYSVPDIVIVSEVDDEGGRDAARIQREMNEVGNLELKGVDIVVTKETIEKLSEYNKFPDKVGKGVAPNGELAEVGRATDIAYLTGVEEGAHTVFIANHAYDTELQYSSDEQKKSMAHYDAQDVEYHGLGWRIRAVMDAAEERKMPHDVAQQALEPLQERMRRAIEIRQKLKAEIGESVE